MKVLHVITRLVRGGARRVVEEIVRGLDRGALQVVAAGTDDAIRAEAEAAVGGSVRWLLHLKRDLMPAQDATAAVEIAALIRRERPDVVHAHTYKAGVIGSVVARAMGVHRVVFTPHGHIFTEGARIPGVPRKRAVRGALASLARVAMRAAHVVTALSEADLRDQVRRGLIAPRMARVIVNGVRAPSPEALAAGPRRRAAWGVSGRGPVFGTLGRLTEEKGHGTLIEAFARVRVRRPKAVLVLIGEGPDESLLREHARRLGVGDAVVFPGYDPEAAGSLAALDVYVHPSYYEGLGIAIVEAMAAGRPVVATRVGGVLDVVAEGRTGLLVPPGDAAALSEAMETLAGEPERAQGMARAGRERAMEKFGVDRMVAAYAEVYGCTTT